MEKNGRASFYLLFLEYFPVSLENRFLIKQWEGVTSRILGTRRETPILTDTKV